MVIDHREGNLYSDSQAAINYELHDKSNEMHVIDGRDALKFLEKHKIKMEPEDRSLFGGGSLKPNSSVIYFENELGEVTGLATVSPVGRNESSLDGVYVFPQFRGGQIGSKLLMAALQWSSEKGLEGKIQIEIISESMARVLSTFTRKEYFFEISGDPDILAKYGLIRIDSLAKQRYEEYSNDWIVRPTGDDLADFKKFSEKAWEGGYGRGRVAVKINGKKLDFVRVLPLKLDAPIFQIHEGGECHDKDKALQINSMYNGQVIPDGENIFLKPDDDKWKTTQTNQLDQLNLLTILRKFVLFAEVKSSKITIPEYTEVIEKAAMKNEFEKNKISILILRSLIPSEVFQSLKLGFLFLIRKTTTDTVWLMKVGATTYAVITLQDIGGSVGRFIYDYEGVVDDLNFFNADEVMDAVREAQGDELAQIKRLLNQHKQFSRLLRYL